MALNLTPDYFEADRKYRQAGKPAEQLRLSAPEVGIAAVASEALPRNDRAPVAANDRRRVSLSAGRVAVDLELSAVGAAARIVDLALNAVDVVVRSVALVHESKMRRPILYFEDLHQAPIEKDVGRPSSLIRFRMLHAIIAVASCDLG